jgi:hypothetical protein
MKLFLLDTGAALLFPINIIVFMVVAIMLEAVVMLLFKLNKFSKCIIDSFIVNLASLIVGFILLSVLNKMNTGANLQNSTVLLWLIMFAVTILVEGVGLMLLNKKKPRERIWVTTITMNLVSYLVLYLFSIKVWF